MTIKALSNKKFSTSTSTRFARRQGIAGVILKVRNITARDVLELLLDRAIKNQANEFVIEGAHRKSIADTINKIIADGDEESEPLCDRSIKYALTQLVEHGFLERYGRGKYRLNPDRYFIGDTNAQIVASEEAVTRRNEAERKAA